MPYIKTIVNIPVAGEKMEAIKAGMGRDVSILGKSESWLMVDFSENSPLYFKGSREPAAMVSVDLFGAAAAAQYSEMTAAITGLLGEQLGIPADRVFVAYQEYQTWGWNGKNF